MSEINLILIYRVLTNPKIGQAVIVKYSKKIFIITHAGPREILDFRHGGNIRLCPLPTFYSSQLIANVPSILTKQQPSYFTVGLQILRKRPLPEMHEHGEGRGLHSFTGLTGVADSIENVAHSASMSTR